MANYYNTVPVKSEPADDDGFMDDLLGNIQKFYNSSTFSDFTIATKGQEFKVHKLIVCSQSGYFARFFERDWKEVTENVIRLDEDDPRAVEAMINFMYGFTYDNSGSEHGRVSPMLFNIRVYQIATKFDIPKLKNEAQGNFNNAIKKCWEMDDFPTAIEDAYEPTTSADRGLRDAVVTVSVNHIDHLLKKDNFKGGLSKTTGFAADIVQRLRA
ncbi:BTB/POZ domain protein [Paecilomyces variotii No. 5]|uniref:BTB/POZ domain protein n=1 Tax=Byssochlamys spectabilis (strain No. 5 / NBRC 109023) TaxID=1356009 RepID=V5FSD4_BYSSN|nr:BTB/POZ domain protein [Paecilomyces variotii No. 5]